MKVKHINCKTLPVQRSAGHSAVAAAAYRAGEKLHDERRQGFENYANRAADVRETCILAPEDAPGWVYDRQTLWNTAETAEKRKDGRPARDIQLGLAWELPEALQREAVLAWAKRELVNKGFVVDIAFHRYGQRVTDSSDEGRDTIRAWAQHYPFLEAAECTELNAPHVKIERTKTGQVAGYKLYQPHAHALIPTRTMTPAGFARTKERWIDRHEIAMNWRYDWPAFHNTYLEQINSDVRVTATSQESEDGDLPLWPESLSQAAIAMERRGAAPEEPRRLGMRRAHNQAVRTAAAHKQHRAAPPVDAGARFARWWEDAIASLPERFSYQREHGRHYWHLFIDRGGGYDR